MSSEPEVVAAEENLLKETPNIIKLIRRRIRQGIIDQKSRKTNIKLNAEILNKALARKNGMSLSRRSKDILKVLELVSYYLTNG